MFYIIYTSIIYTSDNFGCVKKTIYVNVHVELCWKIRFIIRLTKTTWNVLLRSTQCLSSFYGCIHVLDSYHKFIIALFLCVNIIVPLTSFKPRIATNFLIIIFLRKKKICISIFFYLYKSHSSTINMLWFIVQYFVMFSLLGMRDSFN